MIGNAAISISGFSTSIQLAYRKMKYNTYGSAISAVFQIPAMVYAAFEFGAIGVAIVWAYFRTIWGLIWTTYIHGKFFQKFHRSWIVQDILPILLFNLSLVTLLKILFTFIGNETRVFIAIYIVSTVFLAIILQLLFFGNFRKEILRLMSDEKI